MNAILDERAADAEVINNLVREIDQLKEKLGMRIIKSTEGKYYTGEFEELSAERVTEIIAEKQAQLQSLEAIAPMPEKPAQPTGPDPNAAAPADQASQAPPAPQDGTQPVAPAAPAQDPNAAHPTAPETPNLQ